MSGIWGASHGGFIMALQRTLSIIKPDAVEKNAIGPIVARLAEEGFAIKAMRELHQSRKMAEGFYWEHRERGFFGELCDFMSRGPSWCLYSSARTPLPSTAM
jgi:nucleoside-diphosphate kinase